MFKILLIIPTHNRKSNLSVLLNNILRHNLTKKIMLNIIIVVAHSTDGTIEMLANSYPDIKVILGNENWWYTKCMNEGFKAAEIFNPDYVLTLNDDVILADNYFIKLFELIKSIDDKTIVSSISLTSTKPHKVVTGGVKKYIRWRAKSIRYFPPFAEVPLDQLTGLYPTWIISGRGILIPYNILKELNYFDEKFPQYGSDDDFGLRAIKAGYKVLISRDLKIFENTRLTSKGAAFNKDGTITFIKSFFNKYSVNSLQKTIRYTIKHGYAVLLPLNILITIIGTSYAYFFKYRKYKATQNE